MSPNDPFVFLNPHLHHHRHHHHHQRRGLQQRISRSLERTHDTRPPRRTAAQSMSPSLYSSRNAGFMLPASGVSNDASTRMLPTVLEHAELPPPAVAVPQTPTWRKYRRNPSLTRHGSGLVLLSIWFLAAWGPMRSVPNAPSELELTVPHTSISDPNTPVPMGRVHHGNNLTSHEILVHLLPRHPIMIYTGPDMIVESLHHSRQRQLPLSKIVGRVSAWICTVLYMTSRLPQIWTNFLRRSVKGLSVLLFIAAIFANSLYSLSILSSPQATGSGRYDFLSESHPFLIGSAGTLVFDFVILIQWFMWHKRSSAPAS